MELLRLDSSDIIVGVRVADEDGNKVTGETIKFNIQRRSDDEWWNGSAWASGAEPSLITAAQVGSTGIYEYTLSSGYDGTSSDYIVHVNSSVVIIQDFYLNGTIFASDAALAAVKSDVTAIKAITDVIPDSGVMSSIAQDSTVAKDATVSKAAGTKGTDNIYDDTNELQTNQGNWLTATGFSTHTVADIWNYLLSAITTVGSIGKLIKDYLDAAITSRGSQSDVTAIKAKTDNLPADPSGLASLSSAHGAGSWESASDTDWSVAERKQIRDALGVDGTKVASTGGKVQDIKTQTDKMNFTGNNIHSIPKAKDAAVGLSTQEKTDTAAEAKKVLFTDTLPEIVDMTDVPKNPTIAQAVTLHYTDRRNGGGGEDDLNQLHNDAGTVILEEDITSTETTVTASKLRDPA